MYFGTQAWTFRENVLQSMLKMEGAWTCEALLLSSFVSQNVAIITEQNVRHSATYSYPRIYVKLKRHDLPYSYAGYDLKHYVLVYIEMFRKGQLFINIFGIFSFLRETLRFIPL
jgi:hypothetical protein